MSGGRSSQESWPSVAVVIPTYNRADLVGKAIDSALAQRVRPVEVVVVDDGSTDATAQVLTRYGDAISVETQTNAGVGAARNRGIRRVTADWVGFLDSDDEWRPGFLEQALRAADRVPDAGLAYTATSCQTPQGVVVGPSPIESPGHDPALKLLRMKSLSTSSSTLIRRDVLDCHGLFREDRELGPAADWELWTRLALRGVRFAYAPSCEALLRVHPANMMSDPERMHRSMELAMVAILETATSVGRCRTAVERAALERDLRARIELKTAVAHYGIGKTRAARQHLLRAAALEPRLAIREPLFLWTLARSMLGDALSSRLRHWKYRRLIGRS